MLRVLLFAVVMGCANSESSSPCSDTWYADQDGDGHGDPAASQVACEASAGVVASNDDCDDSEATIFPLAAELCDGLDNDCDGLVDDADGSLQDGSVFYLDGDGDGSGAGEGFTFCEQPEGFVTNVDDCDDASDAVFPSAPVICGDGVVNNCNSAESDERASCALRGELFPEDADQKFVSESASDGESHAMSRVGDVDGDGLTDVVFGVAYASGGADEQGAAYVVLGSDAMDGELGSAYAKFVGEDDYDYAGYAVSGVGDVDADGFGDVLIGAYGADNGLSYSGMAYLVTGIQAGEMSLSEATARFTGEGSFDYAGYSVGGAGDVNADGRADMLVGAPYAGDLNNNQEGVVYLISGSSSGTVSLSDSPGAFYGEDAEDCAGLSLSGGNDVDGDGLDDVLIGAPYNSANGTFAGAAYLVLGDSIGGELSLEDADTRFYGESFSDQAGKSVSVVEDVDGDGNADVLIGANQESSVGSSSGAVYLITRGLTGSHSLNESDAKFTGNAGAYVGYAVSGAGDVNGDGVGDMLMGAPMDNTVDSWSGTAYLVYGPMEGSIALEDEAVKLRGESAYGGFGGALSGAGDVNGDGLDDVLVGERLLVWGSTAEPSAYLFLGNGI